MNKIKTFPSSPSQVPQVKIKKGKVLKVFRLVTKDFFGLVNSKIKEVAVKILGFSANYWPDILLPVVSLALIAYHIYFASLITILIGLWVTFRKKFYLWKQYKTKVLKYEIQKYIASVKSRLEEDEHRS